MEISGLSQGAEGGSGMSRVLAGAFLSRSLRKVASMAAAESEDEGRLERLLRASLANWDRSMDLMFRTVIERFEQVGGEIFREKRIAEWSEGRSSEKSSEESRLSDSNVISQSRVCPSV